MEILLIGNGFDIDNEFPTKYIDFIKFMNVILELEKENDLTKIKRKIMNKLNNNEITDFQKEYYSKLFDENKDRKDEILKLLKDNSWYNHFCYKINRNGLKGKKWLDFEEEIDRIVNILKEKENEYFHIDSEDSDDIEVSDGLLEIIRMLKINNWRRIRVGDKICIKRDEFDDYINKLNTDLKDIIRCFEIYLVDYINNSEINYYNPTLYEIKPDKVLSFNYTNTYERHSFYKRKDTEFYYIHGKAGNLQNNMVLGIYGEEETNKFDAFEKREQRIKNNIKDKVCDWLDEIEQDQSAENNLYIFGHSLTAFDKDVLGKLISNQYIKTTIFYHDETQKDEVFENLKNIVGKTNAVELCDSTKVIFTKQKDKRLIKNSEFNVIIESLLEKDKQFIKKIQNEINAENTDFFINKKNVALTHFALFVLNNLDCLDTNLEEKLVNIAQKLSAVDKLYYDVVIKYCKDQYKNNIESNYKDRIKTQIFIQKVLEKELVPA